MNKKVLLTAAAAALLVIAVPRPAAKAMIPLSPALEQDGATIEQVRERGGGRGRSFGGGGGRELFLGDGRGGGGSFRGPHFGGGSFRAHPGPRSYGWSGGGSRGFAKPYAGGHGFRDHGVKRDVFRGEQARSWARDEGRRSFEGRKVFTNRRVIEGGKIFDHRKFDGGRNKFSAGREFDDGKFGFRNFDGHRKKFFADRKFDDDNFIHKRRRALFFVGPLVDFDNGFNGFGCEWLKWKALQTGSPYWWRRYEWCRYG